jgi:transposase
LRLPGASVRSVAFTDQGIVIGLRRRRRRLVCPCSKTTKARYDTSRRRWRHLDFGACQVWLEADIHRLDCRSCGRVRTEQVPWARPSARHTTDFENMVAWLAQRMDKSSIARLLRCSSSPSTALKRPASRPSPACPVAATGAAPGSSSAPARNVSTINNAGSLHSYADTATAYGAPGN